LVTDIGNDILYGASVRQIAGWVETCLTRLAPACQRLAITRLPMESLAGLGRRRFLLMRTVLFPWSRLELGEARKRAEQLNQCLLDLAARYDARVVAPDPLWYGLDPIHIRMRRRRAAWRSVLAAWRPDEMAPGTAPSPAPWLLLHRLRPLRRRWFGIEQHQPQPSGRLPDGSLISLY
jgi:hypothetical protein